jgi:hypothetical protein
MRAHDMTKVADTRLDAAMRWIVDDVIGGGRIKAGLPRALRGEMASALVDLPDYGWPDSQSALDDLDADEQFVAAKRSRRV